MASQTQGIQQLLTAEKRAAEKVAEARKRNYLILFSFHSFSCYYPFGLAIREYDFNRLIKSLTIA